MIEAANDLNPVSPVEVLRKIAEAVPEDCRDNIIIIGSLAVGYHFQAQLGGMAVRTKDADTLLSPNIEASAAATRITEKLLDTGWQIRKDKNWDTPGDENTPVGELPVVRLHPPGITDWYIELLTVPDGTALRSRNFIRIETRHGHFALCSFFFLSIVNYKPVLTDLTISTARPEMMALANLLEHPSIGPELMSAGFAGIPNIKRSNKDLGRVIAIAWLAMRRDEDELLQWSGLWIDALKTVFPDDWINLAQHVGMGLKALLANESDFEQAYFTCVSGLLASAPPTLDQFRTAGKRLLQDAIIPCEDVASHEM